MFESLIYMFDMSTRWAAFSDASQPPGWMRLGVGSCVQPNVVGRDGEAPEKLLLGVRGNRMGTLYHLNQYFHGDLP